MSTFKHASFEEFVRAMSEQVQHDLEESLFNNLAGGRSRPQPRAVPHARRLGTEPVCCGQQYSQTPEDRDEILHYEVVGNIRAWHMMPEHFFCVCPAEHTDPHAFYEFQTTPL